MKKFFRMHRVLSAVLAVTLALATVGVSAFVGVTIYNLNQTVGCSVTITQPAPTTVQVALYSDLQCTIPIGANTLQFTTTDTNGNPFATAYFMSSNNVMGGKYASGIDGATIAVTSTLSASVGTVSFIVGSTSQSGNHGCPIIFMITPTALGASSLAFNITVTGTGV
jgi:hypothetical protein